ncbi:MAG: regulatory protein RecX [Clostridia bacterium]|nr:regulatory protein RecX [Clostridia bacterium]
MDRVVEIKRQHGVATVKLMSGETLKIPSALYLERKLHVNQPLDPEEYRLFMMQRGYSHALEAAMKYLALRERSKQEIVSRLRRSQYDEATVQKVLAALNLHELVSDERFAEQWVHSRARKYGKNRIAQELRMKGVSGEQAQAALDAVPEEEEYERCLAQAKKLCRKFQNDPKKIAQSLTRKGYTWAMARRAAEEAAKDDL